MMQWCTVTVFPLCYSSSVHIHVSVLAVLSLPLCSGGPLELFFGKSALWVSGESNKIHRAALQGDGLLFLIH